MTELRSIRSVDCLAVNDALNRSWPSLHDGNLVRHRPKIDCESCLRVSRLAAGQLGLEAKRWRLRRGLSLAVAREQGHIAMSLAAPRLQAEADPSMALICEMIRRFSRPSAPRDARSGDARRVTTSGT